MDEDAAVVTLSSRERFAWVIVRPMSFTKARRREISDRHEPPVSGAKDRTRDVAAFLVEASGQRRLVSVYQSSTLNLAHLAKSDDGLLAVIRSLAGRASIGSEGIRSRSQ